MLLRIPAETFPSPSYTLKATLVVAAVGLDTREIKVSSTQNLLVALQPSKASLQEVVVTGYTTQRKMDIVGAFASVAPVQLRGVSSMLAGKVPA